MEIVIEYVLLENLFINLIVLKTVALLTKEKGRFFLLASFLSACLTVALPSFYLSTFGYFLVEFGVAILSVCLSFKFNNIKKFLFIFLCFLISLFVYGGACFIFESLFGIQSILIVLGIVISVYIILKYVLKKFNRKVCIDKFCFDVEIDAEQTKTYWKGFLDSGNMLFDPLTESPVTLVNFKVFSSIYKEIDLQDVILRTAKLKKLRFAHYINFNTLGKDNKILVFQVDKIVVNGKVLEKATLGLSLKDFDKSFDTDIILHNNFASLGI